MLAARAGDGGIDHAGAADGGAGDGMEAVIELAGDAEGSGVGGAGGRADFNEAGGGLRGDAKGETRGTAHEDVGRLAVDERRRAGRSRWGREDAGQLDFAAGQSGGREDVVDARQRASCQERVEEEARAMCRSVRTRCATATLYPKHTARRPHRRRRCPSPREGARVGARETAW